MYAQQIEDQHGPQHLSVGMREGADEIRRLQKAVQEGVLQNFGDTGQLSDELSHLKAENAKLRAAISWIMPPFVDENTPEEELRQRIAFAVADVNRAALEGPQDRMAKPLEGSDA
jgi:hypothetical protein